MKKASKGSQRHGFQPIGTLRSLNLGKRDGPKYSGKQQLSRMDEALLNSKCIYCNLSQLLCDCEKILSNVLDIALKRYRKQVPDFSHDLQDKLGTLKKKMDEDKKRFTQGADQLVVHHLDITIKVLEDVMLSARLFQTINVEYIIIYYLELFGNLISKKDYINEINSKQLSTYFLMMRSRLICGFFLEPKDIVDYAKKVIENNKRGTRFEYPIVIELKKPETVAESVHVLKLEPVATTKPAASMSVPESKPDETVTASAYSVPIVKSEPVALATSVPDLNLEPYETYKCDCDCDCDHTPPPSPPNLGCRRF